MLLLKKRTVIDSRAIYLPLVFFAGYILSLTILTKISPLVMLSSTVATISARPASPVPVARTPSAPTKTIQVTQVMPVPKPVQVPAPFIMTNDASSPTMVGLTMPLSPAAQSQLQPQPQPQPADPTGTTTVTVPGMGGGSVITAPTDSTNPTHPTDPSSTTTPTGTSTTVVTTPSTGTGSTTNVPVTTGPSSPVQSGSPTGSASVGTGGVSTPIVSVPIPVSAGTGTAVSTTVSGL